MMFIDMDVTDVNSYAGLYEVWHKANVTFFNKIKKKMHIQDLKTLLSFMRTMIDLPEPPKYTGFPIGFPFRYFCVEIYSRIVQLACYYDNSEIIRMFLENRIPIDFCDPLRNNLLHYACEFGSYKVLQTLLCNEGVTENLDLNPENLHHETPQYCFLIDHACREKEPVCAEDIFNKLVTKDLIRLEAPYPKHFPHLQAGRFPLLCPHSPIGLFVYKTMTWFQYLCAQGHLDVVQEILKQDIPDTHLKNITTRSKHGFTAIHFACLMGQLEVLKILIDFLVKNGVSSDIALLKCNWRSRAPLLWAALKGRSNIVQYILDQTDLHSTNKYPSIWNYYRESPLLWRACLGGNKKTVKLVLNFLSRSIQDITQSFTVFGENGAISCLRAACNSGTHFGNHKIVKLILTFYKENSIPLRDLDKNWDCEKCQSIRIKMNWT